MTHPRVIRATNGANIDGASAHNRRIMVDALRLNGPLSRADLARATQLTKQTVSNIIDGLERDGLVRSLAPIRPPRGKPVLPFGLVPEGAYSLGLQIDRHVCRVVATNLIGDTLLKNDARSPRDDPEAGLAIILRLIEAARSELRKAAPDSDGKVVGLGVAMPGPFGTAIAIDDPWAMTNWQRFPLVERLTAATGLEVSLQNDAAAAAIAERFIGVAHGVDHAICLYLGHGLGAGLILNGERFGGLRGNAGDLGMILEHADAAPTARLEHFVSLASLAAVMGIDPSDLNLFEKIETALKVDDPAVAEWIDVAAQKLRWAVHLLETIFDPQTVILCGGAPKTLIDRLIVKMLPLMVSLSAHPDHDMPRIQPGRADVWAVALGAAAEPIARGFDPRFSALLKG